MSGGAEAAPQAQQQHAFPFIRPSAKRTPHGDRILPEMVCDRYVYLDVTRISCIIVITLCASDPSWLEYNSLFFQNWVMQYLWLVCGICYGLSSRPLLQYLGRLLLFFSVGIAANWTACRIKKDVGLPVGGNMWFVLILAIFSLLLKPLKMRIRLMSENPQELLTGAAYGCQVPDEPRLSNTSNQKSDLNRLYKGIVWMCGGLSVLLLMSSLVILSLGGLAVQTHTRRGSKEEELALRFVMHFCSEVQACLSAVWILWSFPQVCVDTSHVTWLLLVNMYTFKLICGYGETAFFSSGFQLLLIGLSAGLLGLSWRQEVSTMVQRYWMVVAFIGAWCFLPGTHGMLIVVEPEDVLVRHRFILLEILLVVGWLVAGAEMVDPKIFEADNLVWLSDWASLLFLSHQAVLIVAPQVSWPVFIALMPASWIFRKAIGGFSSSEQPDVGQ